MKKETIIRNASAIRVYARSEPNTWKGKDDIDPRDMARQRGRSNEKDALPLLLSQMPMVFPFRGSPISPPETVYRESCSAAYPPSPPNIRHPCGGGFSKVMDVLLIQKNDGMQV
jgi:hypothetical protein